MRTTLDIDRALLERAKTALSAGTYTEAIERSLEQAIQRAELDDLLSALQGSDVVWSVEELRSYRAMELGDSP